MTLLADTRTKVSTCIALASLSLSHAAQFAQITGDKAQNIARVEKTPWSNRWGVAVCALDYNDAEAKQRGQAASIFVFGGDDYDDLHGGGFQNDVYSTEGRSWYVYEHPLLYNKRSMNRPRLYSTTKWVRINEGKRPEPSVPYDFWISCKAEKAGVGSKTKDPVGCDDIQTPPGKYESDAMWSPRRNHAAVAKKSEGELFILGGRAREGMDMSQRDTFGGLVGGFGGRSGRFDVRAGHDWHDKTILKNDVWRSKDRGKTWLVANPGCKAEQKENTRKSGDRLLQCKKDEDCYGDAKCDAGTCVCQTWSPRERMAVVEWDEIIYVIGGFVDRQVQNCGLETSSPGRKSGDEFACGGGYRGYMNDVWRSGDGRTWEMVTAKAPFAGRGEHVAFIMENNLYIAGGRTGHTWEDDTEHYLSDLWEWKGNEVIEHEWEQLPSPEWAPRGDHAVVVLPRSSKRPNTEYVFIMGGQGGTIGDETFMNDVWYWTGDRAQAWIRDYDNHSHAHTYVALDSPISKLKLGVPDDLIRDEHISILASKGIHTIEQLAHIDRETVISLRIGEAGEQPLLPQICHQKWLAQAVFDKCSIQPDTWDLSDSELTNQAVHADGLKGTSGVVDEMNRLTYVGDLERLSQGGVEVLANSEGGAGGFTFNNQGGQQYDRVVDSGVIVTDNSDPWEQEKANWDGCEQIGMREQDPSTGEDIYADIDAIPQEQVDVRNRDYKQAIWRFEEEIICRYIWSPRSYLKGVRFQDEVYIVGGYEDKGGMSNAVWYRDANLPVTSFTLTPADASDEKRFEFIANEDGATFEYRIIRWSDNKVLCNWTSSAGWVNLDWISGGVHRIRVRAVDPAGNYESSYEEGRNQLTWEYVPPIPWELILGCIGGFMAFCLAVRLEYRRRRRKAAMERYAIKRMRRKFKGAKKGGAKEEKEVDWKKYGKAAKKASKDTHKKKKAGGAKKGDGKEKKAHKKSGDKKHKHKKGADGDHHGKSKHVHKHHKHESHSKGSKAKGSKGKK